jgi:sodium-dependent dicarboxylate transporter 2/3/5
MTKTQNNHITVFFVSAFAFLLYMVLPLPAQTSFGLALLFWVGVMWMGELWPLPVTALAVPVLAVLSQTLNTSQALANFAHPIIFLNLGSFSLAAALHFHKVDRRLAGWVTHFAGDSVPASFILLFIATALLSMWISNTATTAMMLPIAIQLVPDRFPKGRIFALLGVAYSANIGGMATIVGSPPNSLAAATLNFTFMEWAKVGVPAVIIFLPIMLFSLYRVVRPEKGVQVEKMQEHKEVWTSPAKKVVAIFALTVVGWVFSAPLSLVVGIQDNMDAMIAITAVVALVATGTVTWKHLQQHVDWGVLILFGGGLCLSIVLSQSGATEWLALTIFGSAESLGWVFLLLSILILVVFLTEFASNLGSAAVLIPLVMAIGDTIFVGKAETMVLAVGLASSCAFMLPVATPPNALVYGTGFVPQRVMLKAGLVLNILAVPILLFVML